MTAFWDGFTPLKLTFEPTLKEAAAPSAAAQVHDGFLDGYKSVKPRLLLLLKAILASSSEKYHVMVTGHSLEGALAFHRHSPCAAPSNDATNHPSHYPIMPHQRSILHKVKEAFTLSLYNFGSPRVGNHAFAARFNQLVGDSWRIANDHDIVPRVPYVFYKHVATGVVLRPDSQKLEKVGGSGVSSTAHVATGGGAVNRIANDHDIVSRVPCMFYKHVATGVVLWPDSQELDKDALLKKRLDTITTVSFLQALAARILPLAAQGELFGGGVSVVECWGEGGLRHKESESASKHSQPAYFLSLLKVSWLAVVCRWWSAGVKVG
ncbi:unnamed protein product [Closterium sp. Naga37s-1]|nr:unnamed protein product [Closterium sp. Naga37s-1]